MSTRTLKPRATVAALGVAAVAALLVMAVGASAAFASSEFKQEGARSISEVTSTGTGGIARFESTGKSYVECEKSSSTGKLVSNKEATTTVTYSGNCVIKGTENGTCPTITTETLTAQPGDQIGGGAAGTEPGLRFTGPGGVLAKFECSGTFGKTQVTVKGALVCESKGASVGAFSTSGEVVCKQVSAGKQQYTQINVFGTLYTGQHLEAEAIKFFTIEEEDAQNTTEKLTYNHLVEQTL